MDFLKSLEAVREAVREPHDPVGQALRAAEAATDDLVVFANNYETRQQVLDNPKIIDRVLANIQLIASLIESHKPNKLRMIRNG